jgi:hypothetical protein
LLLLDLFFLGFFRSIISFAIFINIIITPAILCFFFSIRIIRILDKTKTLEITKSLAESIIASKSYNIIGYPRNRLRKKKVLVLKFLSNLDRYKRFSNNCKYKRVLIITNIN